MKTFLIMLGTIVACAMGYWAEPKLRPHISSLPSANKPKTTAGANTKSTTTPETTSRGADGLLPEKVTLKKDVQFADEQSGLTMTIAAGSEVRLLRIESENAVVRVGETDYTILVPISHTDLRVRLSQQVQAPIETTPEPVVKPEPAPVPAVTPEPAPAPAVTPEPAPAQAVTPEPAPAPAPEVTPQPAPQPAPQPEPEPTPAPAPAPEATPPANTPVNVVAIMRESIRKQEIKEFTFAQVKDWQAAADETIDGQVYQTGVLSYEDETIFGVKVIQAKALIQNGKVVRWIWPKSGVQIQ